ncbi:MAG: cysteine--tRNA ligase [Candidatus Pacebacteria bacterium]|nr:cysteine--tRNA ligase [Candidatus Paceibacterota bacterium]
MFQKNKQQNKTPIYLKNTMSGEKEEFKPLMAGKVRMYNCGPTVYNELHIGNLRAYIFADTLRRTLEYNGYEVQQVINITDVGHLVADSEDGEDKMEKRAKETGGKAQDIAKQITSTFLDNLTSLGIDIKQIEFPRATDYIKEQIEMTKTLLEKGYAYITDNGVAFDTALFKDYGKLGNIDIEAQQTGSRVEQDPLKRNLSDFWLWKFNKSKKKRQQEWESPWGVGFPGWHLECSAMSRALLGRQLDIHTGGIDHIPVHHNNEIAQSESVNGKKFVNYWMHNAFLMFDGKRFEKSTGHVLYLRQIIDRGYNPLALRYLLLSTNYDSEQNFTWDALEASSRALLKLRKYYSDNLINIEVGDISREYKENFIQAINDNLGTPRGLALMWELVKDTEISNESKKATLEDFNKVLGLHFTSNTIGAGKSKKLSAIPAKVTNLLKSREQARKDKNWEESDNLRDKIKGLGYEVIDDDSEQKLSTL